MRIGNSNHSARIILSESEYEALGSPDRVAVALKGDKVIVSESRDGTVCYFQPSARGYCVTVRKQHTMHQDWPIFGTEEVDFAVKEGSSGKPYIEASRPTMRKPLQERTVRKSGGSSVNNIIETEYTLERSIAFINHYKSEHDEVTLSINDNGYLQATIRQVIGGTAD